MNIILQDEVLCPDLRLLQSYYTSQVESTKTKFLKNRNRELSHLGHNAFFVPMFDYQGLDLIQLLF